LVVSPATAFGPIEVGAYVAGPFADAPETSVVAGPLWAGAGTSSMP
jgi:hypothetical protein